jgi:hypothetical protein
MRPPHSRHVGNLRAEECIGHDQARSSLSSWGFIEHIDRRPEMSQSLR